MKGEGRGGVVDSYQGVGGGTGGGYYLFFFFFFFDFYLWFCLLVSLVLSLF